MKSYQLLINGQWRSSLDGKTFVRKNPANGEPVAEFAKAGVEDARIAVSAAREAFDKDEWSGLSGKERSDLLYRVYQRIVERSDELADILSREMGKPLSEAKGEIGAAANITS